VDALAPVLGPQWQETPLDGGRIKEWHGMKSASTHIKGPECKLS